MPRLEGGAKSVVENPVYALVVASLLSEANQKAIGHTLIYKARVYMAEKWTITSSRPGVTDELQFDSAIEAITYAEGLSDGLQDATIAIIDPKGNSRVIRSGDLSASA